MPIKKKKNKKGGRRQGILLSHANQNKEHGGAQGLREGSSGDHASKQQKASPSHFPYPSCLSHHAFLRLPSQLAQKAGRQRQGQAGALGLGRGRLVARPSLLTLSPSNTCTLMPLSLYSLLWRALRRKAGSINPKMKRSGWLCLAWRVRTRLRAAVARRRGTHGTGSGKKALLSAVSACPCYASMLYGRREELFSPLYKYMLICSLYLPTLLKKISRKENN